MSPDDAEALSSEARREVLEGLLARGELTEEQANLIGVHKPSATALEQSRHLLEQLRDDAKPEPPAEG